MTTRSAAEIEAELERLRIERDEAIARENEQAEAAAEAEKRAEEERKKAEQAAIKRRIERYEVERRQALEAEKRWWRELRERCYIPAPGEFSKFGLCATFIEAVVGEGQPCDWCHQCAHGWLNPSWLAGVVHKELARVGG